MRGTEIGAVPSVATRGSTGGSRRAGAAGSIAIFGASFAACGGLSLVIGEDALVGLGAPAITHSRAIIAHSSAMSVAEGDSAVGLAIASAAASVGVFLRFFMGLSSIGFTHS